MKATIYPSKLTQNNINIPPSKSMAHRAIICASLASGTSIIKNVAYSNDINATIAAMEALNAVIIKRKDSLVITGMQGISQSLTPKVNVLESGSTLRFLIPIFSQLTKSTIFYGSERLFQRPLDVYAKLFKQQSLQFTLAKNSLEVAGKLKPKKYYVDGSISSQFISGLLFILPMMSEDSQIIIENEFESKSYVALTIAMLKKFNVNVRMNDDNTIDIFKNQHYLAADYTVEGDYSQLAFYGVLAAINQPLNIYKVAVDSLQGDKAIIAILKNQNAIVAYDNDHYQIRAKQLNGQIIDLKDCPDLGPILMVLGALSKQTTTLINAGRLRIKESDRILAMETELRKLNVKITSSESVVTIYQSEIKVLDPNLSSHNDHRIAMALAVLATIADCPVNIFQAEAVKKSYPDFYQDLSSLGVKIEYDK